MQFQNVQLRKQISLKNLKKKIIILCFDQVFKDKKKKKKIINNKVI